MGKYIFVSEYTKFVRKLRVDNDEYLVQFSRRVERSISYLSKIETGKRMVPMDLVNRIMDAYKLDVKDRVAIKNAARIHNEEYVRLNVQRTD